MIVVIVIVIFHDRCSFAFDEIEIDNGHSSQGFFGCLLHVLTECGGSRRCVKDVIGFGFMLGGCDGESLDGMKQGIVLTGAQL